MAGESLVDSEIAAMMEVNSMDCKQFVEMFGSVIERTPLAAATVWKSRPFNNLTELHREFSKFLEEALNAQAKIGIIRCYSDLSRKLTDDLSNESVSERKAAGLLELTDIESQKLCELNKRYKKRFGFPFVICSKENNKQGILERLNIRLKSDKVTEVREALSEITKIAWYRLNHIIPQNIIVSKL